MRSVRSGSLNARRGSVVRYARSRNAASTASPCACLITNAASSGSYSEPSAMTRAVSRPSWLWICATDISGNASSPRRAAASSEREASIAASPPLTAMYI